MFHEVRRAAQLTIKKVTRTRNLVKAVRVCKRYRKYTMISRSAFVNNLVLCAETAPATGCIVEAGVWRGGMSAAMAEMLPGRVHYLFDSFEGLPPAKEIDGEAALKWQQDVNAPTYYDNCAAEQSFAEEAMAIANAKKVHIVKGWFNETVSGFVPAEPIAILRLDGDWYESTMECLSGLFPHVMQGGLIILDDYFSWDGCARALHDYLSANQCTERIEKWGNVCYLVKRAEACVR
jgi:O-methyltransferase